MTTTYFILIIFIALVVEVGVIECLLRRRELWLLERELKTLIKDNNVSGQTFNIYYFGSSTMVGVPYAPSLSIPKLVSYMLDYQIQNKPIRFINIAYCAADFNYNLARLRIILKKETIFHPSLCVIYSGHNEFLKYTREYAKEIFNNRIIEFFYTRSCLGKKIINRTIPNSKIRRYGLEERNLFDQPLFKKNKYKEVIEIYKARMMHAIKLLSKYKVPCIISTVVGNYADFEPNRSVFSSDEVDKDEFGELIDNGEKALSQKNFNKAQVYYLKALSFCGDFAEAHYRLGNCYQMQNNYAQAWEEYKKTVDCDGMPVRATEEQNDFIRKIRTDNVIFTVDAVEYLRKYSPYQIIGFNLMIDGNHPNITGYILISQLIAQKIKEIFHETKQLRPVTESEARKIFSVDNKKMSGAYNYTGLWLLRFANWRYNPFGRLQKAEEYFLQAMAIDASSYWPYLGLGLCSFIRKDIKKAENYISQAKAVNSVEVDNYLKDYWNNQIIKRAYKQ